MTPKPSGDLVSNISTQHPPRTSRSAIWIDHRALAVREVPVPALQAGELLVRIRAAGICGSDLHTFRVETPRRRMAGVGPGHELAGEVVARAPDVSGPAVGSRVAVFSGRICTSCDYCRSGRPQLCTQIRFAGQNSPGGMGEYFVAQAGMVYAIPNDIDWPVAALSEPFSISVHGMKKAGLARGQRVLVIGAGTIGLLAALVALDAGAERVAIVARHEHQAAAARALGVHDVFEPAQLDARGPVARMNWDIVVESVGGTAPTLQQAIDVVGRNGTVLLLGVHHVPQSIVTTRVFLHELTIVGAIGCNYLGPRSDFDESLALIQKYHDRVAPLVTHTFPLEHASEAFATAFDKRSGAIKVTVLP